MGRIKYAVDSPHVEGWTRTVGLLILNFSALEFESLMWLTQMSEQTDRFREFSKLRFLDRVKEIEQHIEQRSYSRQWRKNALRTWNDGRKIAALRNRIAHNPLSFAWRSDSTQSEPDYIGVLGMSSSTARLYSEGALMSKQQVEASTNQITVIVRNLESLRHEWCGIRDQTPEARARALKLNARLMPRIGA